MAKFTVKLEDKFGSCVVGCEQYTVLEQENGARKILSLFDEAGDPKTLTPTRVIAIDVDSACKAFIMNANGSTIDILRPPRRF